MAQIDLRPVRISRDPARRSTQLLSGLALYGISVAMLTRAHLGLEPWGVLAEGVTKHTGLTFGTATGLISVTVLLLWIPLRQRPGIGTVANVVVVAVVVDLARAVLPDQHDLGWRIVFLIGGVALNGFATATYVGARLGPGARDGLMTGLAARTGRSVRLVRTCLEISAVVAGFALGGTVGFGTVLYALAIGPLTQAVLPLTTWRGEPRQRP
ncbi:hypothetical protein DMA12_30750 [Amycolatopsis balhimycina DSM 5908]|uniref:YitT family protein n=1 Tax=Amycolatopsis balhimycina DSM 5908 TaxID=1081091 RepID=A0A428W8B4_AMYBA|nr:membrane protein [Amycolatopsis balhimycina]RSM39197.1 hypothetical protein DMA12_30750 [Amycolatopsis balhimycina DSM 5908]